MLPQVRHFVNAPVLQSDNHDILHHFLADKWQRHPLYSPRRAVLVFQGRACHHLSALHSLEVQSSRFFQCQTVRYGYRCPHAQKPWPRYHLHKAYIRSNLAQIVQQLALVRGEAFHRLGSHRSCGLQCLCQGRVGDNYALAWAH